MSFFPSTNGGARILQELNPKRKTPSLADHVNHYHVDLNCKSCWPPKAPRLNAHDHISAPHEATPLAEELLNTISDRYRLQSPFRTAL